MLIAPLLLVLIACAAPAGRPSPGDGAPAPPAASTAPQRTLVVGFRGEPPSLASKPLVVVDGSVRGPLPMVNATLDGLDERGIPYPYLAEALPQLNTDTWRLLPDGRMETQYRLRPNLTWHDGTALSGEDFVFAWRVYGTAALGHAASPPLSFMEEVAAPDPRTVVIRWKQPYGEAGAISDTFQALPRHLLQQPFQELEASAFVNLPFWTTEYVGLGAYKLERWEPGAFIEARAFDGYALGKPRIDRMKIVFLPDANTALANLLSGEVHYIGDFVFGVEQAANLERQWAATQGGTILYAQTTLRVSAVQLRPEFALPAAQRDVRVRRALFHGIDGPTANEVLNRGRGLVTGTLTSPNADYYGEIDRVIAKYPFDPRRAQQLMEEAGYARGSDGFFRGRDGSQMDFNVWFTASAKNEQENAVIVDSLRKSGFDATSHVVSAAQLADGRTLATTPGLSTRGHSKPLLDYTTDQIQSPENRWRGGNRGGWSNPAYDRTVEAYSSALDRTDRIRNAAELERIFTEELPSIPHWFSPNVTAHVATLKGPVARVMPETTAGTLRVHEWEWRS
jgi:peptide/nickel transport system substrate-binding protein